MYCQAPSVRVTSAPAHNTHQFCIESTLCKPKIFGVVGVEVDDDVVIKE